MKCLQSKAHNEMRTSSKYNKYIPPCNLNLIHVWLSASKAFWFSASEDPEVGAPLHLTASESRLPMNVKTGKLSLDSEGFPPSLDFTKIDQFCSSVFWLLRSRCLLYENEPLANFQLCELWELMENPQA